MGVVDLVLCVCCDHHALPAIPSLLLCAGDVCRECAPDYLAGMPANDDYLGIDAEYTDVGTHEWRGVA